MAFRGSSSDARDRNDTDPRVFAGRFVATGFSVLLGTTPPEEVVKLYAPRCSQGEKGTQLKLDMLRSQALVPRDQRVMVGGVEFGDGFEVVVTSSGYAVTLPGSQSIRLHVDGEWVTAHDQLVALGLEQPDDGEEAGHLALEFVAGKLRVASC